MYNSQYYTCEQIDQRLLQGYLDDYNSQNNTNLTKAQFLTKLYDALENYEDESEVLDLIEDYLGSGFLYAGLATPTGTPTLPQNHKASLFFIAINPGTYTNYGNINITNVGLHLIVWDKDTWSYDTVLEVDQQTGQSTTKTMSQKAITDKLGVIDDKINALAAGVKVTLAISPNIIYKGYSQSVTLTGTMINGTPSKMELLDGSTVLAESTSSPITRSDLAVNLTGNSKTFGVRGTVNGITINNTETLNARYPIYYGFGENASAVAISSNRYAATTTAAHTYEKTSSVSGQHFFILVPSDISALSNFSMGGAPFVMTSSTATIDGVTYKVYTSGNVYNSGTKLTVVAS